MGQAGSSIAASGFKILTAGLIITFLVVGGGFTLPFLSIPWYVWGLLLLLLILFISRK